MSGGQAASTSSPGVPDEFAAAYWEAYERALRDQTDAARHRRPAQYRPGYVPPTASTPPHSPAELGTEASPVEPVDTRPPSEIDLPERRGRLVVGTRRDERSEESWFDRARGSRWWVPALLVALAVVLVLGAYVMGRAFTAAVASG